MKLKQEKGMMEILAAAGVCVIAVAVSAQLYRLSDRKSNEAMDSVRSEDAFYAGEVGAFNLIQTTNQSSPPTLPATQTLAMNNARNEAVVGATPPTNPNRADAQPLVVTDPFDVGSKARLGSYSGTNLVTRYTNNAGQLTFCGSLNTSAPSATPTGQPTSVCLASAGSPAFACGGMSCYGIQQQMISIPRTVTVRTSVCGTTAIAPIALPATNPIMLIGATRRIGGYISVATGETWTVNIRGAGPAYPILQTLVVPPDGNWGVTRALPDIHRVDILVPAPLPTQFASPAYTPNSTIPVCS